MGSVYSASPETLYLTTAGESTLILKPRNCRVIGRMSDGYRDDFMVVEIEPPLIGQSFGLGGEDIRKLLLATRHQGFTLFPVTEWPSHVYIIRTLDEKTVEAQDFRREQTEIIGWGFLFNDLATAKEFVGITGE